jgi:hypothetical protein
MNYPIPFGKYLLLERVNVGGMAEVFKAKAFGVEGFERILAIKRILPNMADDDEFINMFVDEARIAVQLSHANIVQIYELGKFDNQYYIAMEYVAGKDLRFILDHVRKKKELLPLPASAFIVSKICEGLDYAHRKADPTGRPLNVIHRDVSPQNILVSYEGAVKITDFGIAKAEDRASKTQAGVLKGKFGYMSPEQVRGLEIDHRSDIFAVGILMYEMITGKRLFLGESDFSTLEKVRNADVPLPSQVNPKVSPELERIMMKTLAKERDDRYQWGSELHDDLQQFLIEDNTIYNAKRCSSLLQTEFKLDIDAEMAKMEEFMKVQAPQNAEAMAGVEQARAAPFKTDPGAATSGEKTMIFESAMAAHQNVATEIAPENVGHQGWQGSGGPGLRPGNDARTGSVVLQGGPRSSLQPRPSYTGHGSQEGSGGQQKHLGAIIIAIAAFLAALILLVVLLAGPNGDVGTIVITSTPTDQVDLYLDGNIIGSKTPLTRNDITVGEHILLARGNGFADRAYRFELVAGNPAVINVELERIAPPPPTNDAMIEVVTDPPGASVRIGGLPQGVTPLTMKNQDPSRPVILEIVKDGYQTITQSVTFLRGQKTTTVRVTMTSASKPPSTVGKGTLVVKSDPPGATVYLGRIKQGVTPLEIPNLDTSKTYDVELAKDGFKRERATAAFKDGNLTLVQETLHELGSTKVREKVKEKAKEKVADAGGGGGKCSGSGAKLSVMPIGEADCKVTVGKADVGVAPFVNKEAPVGRCDVKVVCASGKKYSTARTLKAGASEKVIIKSGDWQ